MRKNELKKIAKRLNAQEIEKMNKEDYNKLRKKPLSEICYTMGQYGFNLILLRDEDGNFYTCGRCQEYYGLNSL